MALRAVHFDFFEQRKADMEIQITKFGNFLAVAGLLLAELIAWKAKYGKSLGFELLLQILQSFILWGKAATTGRVYNQQNIASKALQGHVLTIDIGDVKSKNIVHGSYAVWVCSTCNLKKFLK